MAYGGGDLASNLILVLTSTFVTFFYTDALGLNAAIIGSIMMFSRLATSSRIFSWAT
ncbi:MULTISPECIES: MFS transporter [Eisenbergiella]|uniref:MFS transporter n=1 Tax=Eisenbergiella TaxID=1432051 RepID=UPI0023F47FEE|nr:MULTISPECIES: MFS transporter [Eisenbergiella]MCI6709595.1 MFS transporter [Eisenbergiella massiliensis]MDY5525758.1 MFS transporter [Eisenbergiella porci]